MITRVSEARHPPRGIRPYTIKGALALLLDPLYPGGDPVVIGGIVTLNGNRVAPRDIRSAIVALTPPGHQYVTRTVQGEQIKVWRVR